MIEETIDRALLFDSVSGWASWLGRTASCTLQLDGTGGCAPWLGRVAFWAHWSGGATGYAS